MLLGGLVLLYGPYRYFTAKRLMDAGYFRPNFWVECPKHLLFIRALAHVSIHAQGVILLVVFTAAAMIAILVLSLVPGSIELD